MDFRDSFMGLAIDDDKINFIEFEKTLIGIKIINSGQVDLPKNTCVSKYDLFNEEVVSESLKEVVKKYQIKAKKAIYMIPESRVLKKKIKLPISATDNEIYNKIKSRSLQIIGENANEIFFDFITEENKEENKLEVTVLATKNETVYQFDNVLEKAGLNPFVADASNLCLSRSNDYIRRKISKENNLSLGINDFLVYFIYESNQYKISFFDSEGEIYSFQREANEEMNNFNEVFDELFFVVEQNNIEEYLQGVVLFNVPEHNFKNVNNLKLPVLNFNLQKEFKANNLEKVNTLSALKLIGVALRQKNNY